MNRKLTVDLVRTEVRRFWQAFSQYDVKTLRRMYGVDAAVFHPSSRRFELGPLTVARYAREYSHPECQIRFELGDIHVSLLGEHAAVASYTFELHVRNVTTPTGLIDRHVSPGRASQVFAFDNEGVLSIIQEHRSTAAKPGGPSLPVEEKLGQTQERYQ